MTIPFFHCWIKQEKYLICGVALFLLLLLPVFAKAQERQTEGVNFAWGAGFAGMIDMGGHDMSTIGMDAYFGLKTPGVEVLGVGVGLNEPVSNSFRSMPIYLIARSSFSVKPQLCFMDLRCGISVNSIEKNLTQTGEYLSFGGGIKLASSEKFTSQLILSYVYMGRRNHITETEEIRLPNLNMVCVRLGICF